MSYYGGTSGHYLPSGTRLNNIYEIEDVVGEGGMGVVYRGRAIETGDPVAIKVIRADMAGNEAALALFRKEASVLNNLLHEAIVRYYVFTRDPEVDRPYLATEFVDGVSLADIIDHHALPRADVVELAIRLAEGLQAAHRLGVVHRDISPDNIILPGRDVKKAKIIDFGIARAAHFGGQTVIGDSIAGKFDYMSPEQLGLYGGNVTPRSDMYSLGIVLAEAALGRPLDMGGTQAAVIEKRRTVPKLDGIEPRLKALLSHMLQPKPTDRPETMTEIAATARSIAGDPPRRSRRGPLIAAAVAVIVIGVGAALYGADALRMLSGGSTDDGSEIVVTSAPTLIPADEPADPPETFSADLDTGANGTASQPDAAAASTASDGGADDAPTPSVQEIVSALGGDTIEPNTPRDGPAEEIRMSGADGTDAIAATADPSATSDPTPPPATTSTDTAAQDGAAEAAAPSTPAADGTGDGASAATSAVSTSAPQQPAPSTTPDATSAASDTETAAASGASASDATAASPPAPDTAESTAASDATTAPPPATGATEEDATASSATAAQPATPATPAEGDGAGGVQVAAADGTSSVELPQPPTTAEAGVLRYVTQYDAGGCTYIRPIEVRAQYAKLEAFGDQVPPFVTFDENFARSVGFEADIGLRLIKPAQCPAVEFLRDVKNGGAQPLDLKLDNDTIRSGFALTGTVSGLGDRKLVVLVINEDGRVYPIDAVSKREGNWASIHTRISGGPQTLQPHLMMVIAADDMPDAATAQRLTAPEFFSNLEKALAGRESSVRAQISYFKFGG